MGSISLHTSVYFILIVWNQTENTPSQLQSTVSCAVTNNKYPSCNSCCSFAAVAPVATRTSCCLYFLVGPEGNALCSVWGLVGVAMVTCLKEGFSKSEFHTRSVAVLCLLYANMLTPECLPIKRRETSRGTGRRVPLWAQHRRRRWWETEEKVFNFLRHFVILPASCAASRNRLVR